MKKRTGRRMCGRTDTPMTPLQSAAMRMIADYPGKSILWHARRLNANPTGFGRLIENLRQRGLIGEIRCPQEVMLFPNGWQHSKKILGRVL